MVGKIFPALRKPLFCVLCLVTATVSAIDSEVGSLKREDAPVPPQIQSQKNETGMGQDIKEFSEEVASRVDRIVKKKAFDLWGDPWTIQGIPLLFPSSSNGFNLGVKVALQNIRRQDPHKLELEAQVLTSDKGRYKHFFRVDYPHALDGNYRFTGKVGYDRDISFPYFGVGNLTSVDRELYRRDDVLYQNVRSGPNFSLQIQRYLSRRWRVGPILGLRWTEIQAPPGSLLQRDQRTGIAGGRTHHIGLAITYDTLDFEPYPSEGYMHELYLRWYTPWLASDYDFVRASYTFRYYYPLKPTLTFATRVFFEALGGDVPFYELGATGGSDATVGFGGDKFIRGWESNRFIDNLRFIAGAELRWDPLRFSFARQEVILGFVPFVDMGRVWPSVFPFDLGDFHASVGWGTRFIWNNRFIIRSDFAMTAEGVNFYVELGSSF